MPKGVHLARQILRFWNSDLSHSTASPNLPTSQTTTGQPTSQNPALALPAIKPTNVSLATAGDSAAMSGNHSDLPIHGPSGAQAPTSQGFWTSTLSHRPGPTRPAPIPRVKDARGADSQTVCFTLAKYATRGHHHLLTCSHEIQTLTPQACGANCALSKHPFATEPREIKFACPERKCAKIQAWELKRERAAFSKTPGLRRCFRSEEEAEEKRGLRRERIVRAGEGRDDGVAMPEDEAEEVLRQAMLGSQKTTYDPSFRGGFGAEDQRDVPHSHLGGYSYEPNASVRNKAAADFSMMENAFYGMRSEENGVAIDSADERVLPRDMVDGEVDIQETHCICHVGPDGFMVECADCSHFFHPVCIGKGKVDLVDYQGDDWHKSMALDRQHYCEMEVLTCDGCDEKREAKIQASKVLTVADLRQQTRLKNAAFDEATHVNHRQNVAPVAVMQAPNGGQGVDEDGDTMMG